MPTFYHVTPSSRAGIIKLIGIQPRLERRGMYADSHVPAIYAFTDMDTAIDGLVNWLADQDHFRDESTATVFEFEWDGPYESDPELAGSVIIRSDVPTSAIRRVEIVDLGDPDDV